ncbi:MAG: hypothetical protein IPJ21_14980 [Sterolibacteriaceae bacterium]|nr:hypothetical protein [Sterolibacteriaceae bacterium]MBK9085082.1 hypothetical protein [Sterolibacteriaceae bacterium]
MKPSTSTIGEIEEIEFAAAYGTAVAMIDKRQRTIGNHQTQSLERGSVTGRLDVAAGTDHLLGSPRASQPDDKAVSRAQPPARRSIRLTAVPDAAEGRRHRPQPRGDTNRGRKAA